MLIFAKNFNIVKILYQIILPVIALLGLLACAGAPADDKIITVSIEPQKFLLEQIVGDEVQVRCLLSDGANPETYDPSMTHMLNLQKSLAYMRMGNIGFEAALIDKIHESHPDLAIYNTSLGVTPITGTHSHGDHDDKSVDPHTWTSVKNAKIIARNMLEAMVEIDPDKKRTYQANYEHFAARLDSLDNAITAKLAPHAGETFMVWHPSLSYFARDYGMNQLVVGGHEQKEQSVGELRSAVDLARESGARVFFIQTDLDSRHVTAINSEIGANDVIINPLSYQWESEITRIADALADTTSVR